jgi:hypothetical protein
MTDGVYAAVDAVEPARRCAVAHRSCAQSQRDHLRERDDTVLAGRDGG